VLEAKLTQRFSHELAIVRSLDTAVLEAKLSLRPEVEGTLEP